MYYKLKYPDLIFCNGNLLSRNDLKNASVQLAFDLSCADENIQKQNVQMFNPTANKYK